MSLIHISPLCGPAAVLVAVHVKIEVFLRHFVVGAVFLHFLKSFVEVFDKIFVFSDVYKRQTLLRVVTEQDSLSAEAEDGLRQSLWQPEKQPH